MLERFGEFTNAKNQIGFFSLTNAENISAVIFSNNGTISKFNRMGMLAGFGSPNVSLIRIGICFNPDPKSKEPLTFSQKVTADEGSETWVEGIEVFHNPNALQPISNDFLPGACHYRVLPDGRVESEGPPWHPFSSMTHVILKK